MNERHRSDERSDGSIARLTYSVLSLCESGKVLVAVQDSGIGLQPESLDHLFKAFFTTKVKEWVWDWRSAVRLSRPTAGSYGPYRMVPAPRFNSDWTLVLEKIGCCYYKLRLSCWLAILSSLVSESFVPLVRSRALASLHRQSVWASRSGCWRSC